MDPEFWRTRWRTKQIGFHQPAPTRWLVDHAEALAPRPGRVLVPLCGKTLDMPFLAERGHQVIGVELAEEALTQFFEEQQVPATSGVEHGLPFEEGAGVRIYQADFLDVKKRHVEPLDAAFDRGALVAIPEARRVAYAEHLLDLLPAGARILLVSFIYDPAEMNGPPFSLPHAEVERLFAARADLRLLGERDILEEEPRFKARGLTWLREAAWLITVAR